MSEIKTIDGGTITYHDYEGNVGYALYVPDNVNADTPIFTYTYGSGRTSDWYSKKHGSGNYGVYDALIEYGGDSIVVMPTMPWSDDWGKNTMKIINSVREEYGITNLNVSGSGFSMGGFAGFDIVAENIKQNPDIDPQVVFFIDDYSRTYYNAGYQIKGRENLFVKNNTIFFAYDPYWKSTNNYQPYVDAGINVVRVEPENFGHVQINSNFFRNGIYDYMAGGSLPSEGYVYKIYNRKTGVWEVVDYSEISTIDNLYDFYGIDTLQVKIKNILAHEEYALRSDNNVVAGYLDNILSDIKNTNFLSTGVEDFLGNSTTNVPVGVSDCARKYFLTVSKVLDQMTEFMDAVALIDVSYQAVDERMQAFIDDNSVGNIIPSSNSSIVTSFGNAVDNIRDAASDFIDDIRN